jgi:hypothetical protein
MEKEFVPYDRSVKLKQLGFDLPTFGYYQSTRLKLQFPLLKSETQPQTYMREEDCSAPTYSQAFRWFREKHGIMHRLTSYAFGYQIHLDNTADFDFEFVDRRYDSGIDYKTYEDAELACLDKLIEIVESKNK